MIASTIRATAIPMPAWAPVERPPPLDDAELEVGVLEVSEVADAVGVLELEVDVAVLLKLNVF